MGVRLVSSEVPSIRRFREAVDQMLDKRDALIVKVLYLTCSRVSETLTHVSPWDQLHKKVRLAYGMHMGFEMATFDHEKLRHKVLVLKMAVAKRKLKRRKRGTRKDELKLFFKTIALPTDPRYEPWTKDLLKYLQKRGNLSFDLSRSHVWKLLKRSPSLHALDPDFTTHDLRHYRITHLVEEYDFQPIDLVAVTGWTYRRGVGVAAGQLDTYLHIRWKKYFPKLLKPL